MDDCDNPSAGCGRGIRSPVLSATEDGTRKRHRWASRRHRQSHSLLSTTGQSRILTPFFPDFFPRLPVDQRIISEAKKNKK